MKVLLLNGSRRDAGCTHTGLNLISEELIKEGIEVQEFSIGSRVLKGEIHQVVEEVVEAAKSADGFVFGTPVYYASPSGEMMFFLDHLFDKGAKEFMGKPGAAIASARRCGNSASLDVLNKYFLFNQMPLIASEYWNGIHGNSPEEVLLDEEGVVVMKTLGQNMAWILKSIEAGKAIGLKQPEPSKRPRTNFI